MHIQLVTDSPCLKVYTQIFICKQKDLGAHFTLSVVKNICMYLTV